MAITCDILLANWIVAHLIVPYLYCAFCNQNTLNHYKYFILPDPPFPSVSTRIRPLDPPPSSSKSAHAELPRERHSRGRGKNKVPSTSPTMQSNETGEVTHSFMSSTAREAANRSALNRMGLAASARAFKHASRSLADVAPTPSRHKLSNSASADRSSRTVDIASIKATSARVTVSKLTTPLRMPIALVRRRMVANAPPHRHTAAPPLITPTQVGTMHTPTESARLLTVPDESRC